MHGRSAARGWSAMEGTQAPATDEGASTDQGASTNPVMRSYMVLRNVIGLIAVGLPFAVFLGNWIIFSHHRFGCLLPIGNDLPDSLSGYYYSHMRNLFVGGMCAAGVFLFFYRGDDRWETLTTNLAGLFAVGIAFFPTTQPNISKSSSCGPVTAILPQPSPHATYIAWVHTGCLIGLMATIAFMALRYTREYTEDQKNKMVAEDQQIERDTRLKSRNKRFYYGCVAGLLVAGIFAVVQQTFNSHLKAQAPWLLYAELIAFVAFGVAWFVKGQAIVQLRQSVDAAKGTLARVMRSRRPKRDLADPSADDIAPAT
jgi:hypothetical protein